ncbi:hypothetical protein [Oceanihabitans sediminis]|uniref:hypothetical protein n=1 Tax=Oceanihabitans sediminis TaxID=1812012 RepID=UPI00299D155D|nr:hypothetical protein [Oceanihabitans sediminis]MDX1278561.1 hypothetical protein [Oceanihabitans sediminis]
MITTKVKVKVNPKLFEKITLPKKLLAAADEIGQIVIANAQSDYLKKKKSQPKMPSRIISSFTYKFQGANSFMVKSVVSSGGPEAPHAIYVDQGHRLRNNKWWKGYEFMKVGRDAGQKEAYNIVYKHLSAK